MEGGGGGGGQGTNLDDKGLTGHKGKAQTLVGKAQNLVGKARATKVCALPTKVCALPTKPSRVYICIYICILREV